jgi:uncharacterized protein (DUF1684 family)
VPDELALTDWRRRVAELYAEVRRVADHERAHRLWCAGRDWLFRAHPQSPLRLGDPLRDSGLPHWPYDRALRFELSLLPVSRAQTLPLQTDGGLETMLRLVGHVELPAPLAATVDVWWLQQYAGGLFLPLRDASAGDTSYGGGRYLLDTAKGADLGGTTGRLVIDLNFLYHPSCRYNPAWQCPLAPSGNTIDARIDAGERL